MAALIIAIFPQNSSRGNWEEQQDRTDPNSRFELARKPAWLLAFRQFGLPKWKHDFECCTFDHSDNSPYKVLPEISSKNRQEIGEINRRDKGEMKHHCFGKNLGKSRVCGSGGTIMEIRFRDG